MKKLINGFIILLIVIIVGGIAVYALYFLPSTQRNTDNSLEGGSLQTNITEGPNHTIEPTKESTQTSSHLIFMDKNNNSVMEPIEEVCTYCYARVLVCSDKSENITPKYSELINVEIGTKGAVSVTTLADGYICWASYEDRRILIPQFTVAGGDSSNNMNIPAVSTTATITGVNMNIGKIFNHSGSKYIYTFNLLVPIIQTRFSENKALWVKFLPDRTKPDLYYIKTGLIQLDNDGEVTGTFNTYYMEIDWNFSEVFTGIQDPLNYTFIM